MMNKDRISELPKNLIEYILERISINEAARTSILSTKWRHIWTNMPKLALDKQFFEGLTPKKRTESSQFVQVVDNILMVHNGPIHKFNIFIPFSQNPNMDIWILYLSRNGVKEIFLFNSYPESYKLPSYIFSCDQLTYLTLYNCVLNAPLEFTGFRNLKELILEKISLSTNTGSLISKLVFLYYMKLWSCLGVENINSLPPSLSCLDVLDGQEVQWQWFQSKTKISALSICLCKYVNNVYVPGKIFKLNSFLSNMPNLSKLVLDGNSLKILAAGDFMEFPQLSLKLKYIGLLFLSFNDLDQVSCALCLLKSFPNLEKLDMQTFSISNDGLEEQDLSYIVNIANSHLKLNCLRSASLIAFTGLKAELAFVKLVLSHSPVLKKMEIKSKCGMDADKTFSISNDGLEEHDLSYIVNIANSHLKLNCLRSARLIAFNGLEAELAFVKLVLSHSPVLKKMEIKSKCGMDADKELEISMQLMRFCRASVQSEIIYTRG